MAIGFVFSFRLRVVHEWAEAGDRHRHLRRTRNYWVRFFVLHILCRWPLTQVLDGWIVGLGGGSRV